MASESSWAGEAAELPEESKFAGVEGSPQLIEEEPAEEAREHMDRQEEAWSATDPARAVERWATTLQEQKCTKSRQDGAGHALVDAATACDIRGRAEMLAVDKVVIGAVRLAEHRKPATLLGPWEL